MKVKKIRLGNGYKRFFDLTIDLGETPKRIVALVGSNGCGKSSVIDGMLYKVGEHASLGSKGTKGYEFHSLNKNISYSSTHIDIDFDKGKFSEVFSMHNREKNTIFSFRSPYRYNTDLKVSSSSSMPKIAANTYGASTSADLDEKMENNYRRLKIMFDKHLENNPETATYHNTKQKIIGELNGSLTNCLDLEISSIGNIEAGEGTLYFIKKDQPNAFEFNVLSSGEKEVVDILLDLYLRKEEFTDTVFLIDEPELHINTSIQKKLLIEINSLVGNNCQIWVATHSIGFLRALQENFKDDCQIIHFKDELKLATEKQTLTPMELTRLNWQSIFNIALDDLTHLLAPQEIIYCEGTLNMSLDEKIFNIIFSKKYYNSLFVSSTSKSESQRFAGIALTVLNKAFESVNIKVLIDRDDDLETPKTSIVNVVKLERREFENYLYDLEIVKKAYDKVDEVEYHKLCKDIVNDDVKGLTKELMLLCCERKPKIFRLNLAAQITEETTIFKQLEKLIFN